MAVRNDSPPNVLRLDGAPACTAACPEDPDLAAVAAAWPDLPAHIKAAVLALVRAAPPG